MAKNTRQTGKKAASSAGKVLAKLHPDGAEVGGRDVCPGSVWNRILITTNRSYRRNRQSP